MIKKKITNEVLDEWYAAYMASADGPWDIDYNSEDTSLAQVRFPATEMTVATASFIVRCKNEIVLALISEVRNLKGEEE